MSQSKNIQAVYNVPITVILEGMNCEWSVNSTAGGDWLQYKPAGSKQVEEGPWELLTRFMALKTNQQALAFLNETGYFSLLTGGIPIEGQGEPEPGFQAGLVRLDDVFEWRDIFRELVRKRPTTWGFALTGSEEAAIEATADNTGFKIVFGGILDKFDFLKALAIVRHTRFSIEFRWGGGRHEAIITAPDTLSAFVGVVCVKHLRGERYDFCARRDCGKLFRWESDHKRKYCEAACAHLVAVRKNRKKVARKGRTRRPQRRFRRSE